MTPVAGSGDTGRRVSGGPIELQHVRLSPPSYSSTSLRLSHSKSATRRQTAPLLEVYLDAEQAGEATRQVTSLVPIKNSNAVPLSDAPAPHTRGHRHRTHPCVSVLLQDTVYSTSADSPALLGCTLSCRLPPGQV